MDADERQEIEAQLVEAPGETSGRTGGPQSALGERLSSKYEIVEEIGSGGMGVVYKARHRITNVNVAIKMMRNFDATGLQRFEQEAKVISMLEHPGIVGLRDFGTTELGQPYMVLDFVDGVTLKEATMRRSLTVDESLEVFEDIADVLHYAHLRGVVHRDIKPSNIMLPKEASKRNRVKVLDFGIARVVDFPGELKTKAGETLGSPQYMSPEQIRGETVDQRADIYSLGVVMFETLTRKPLFEEEDVIQITSAHLNKTPRTVRSLAPWLSAELEEIVGKCLGKNPSERYQSMSELRHALTMTHSAKKTSSAPTGEAGKTTRMALLIACLCLSLSGLGALTWLLVKPLGAPISKAKKVVDIEPPEFLSMAKDGKLAKEELAAHYNDPVVNLTDYFGQITEQDLAKFDKAEKPEVISLSESDVTGPGLAHLIHLAHLRRLNLCQSGLGDRAMAEIGHMTQLRNLDLSKTNVDDEGLKALKNLKNLRVLDLRDESNITSAGLANLVTLENLKELNLSKSVWITGGGLAHLAKLPALETLRLSMSAVKDGDLRELRNFKALQLVALRGTDISDAGVAELAQLKVSSLDLGSTKITDKSLALLESIPTLRRLGMHQCQISGPAVEALQEKCPDLKIFWDSPKFLAKLHRRIGRESEIYSDVAGGIQSKSNAKNPGDYDVPFNSYLDYW